MKYHTKVNLVQNIRPHHEQSNTAFLFNISVLSNRGQTLKKKKENLVSSNQIPDESKEFFDHIFNFQKNR